jgi:YesN/AraC family two-component response regulator
LPQLRLEQCANALECPPQLLSVAIQASRYKNFRDLVNHFRVEMFKVCILRADLKKTTIMSVAYDCGFNSEPSFYRIFKEKTGLTPKAFLEGGKNSG